MYIINCGLFTTEEIGNISQKLFAETKTSSIEINDDKVKIIHLQKKKN